MRHRPIRPNIYLPVARFGVLIFSSGPDPGSAIVKHLVACDGPSLSHPEATRLHAMNVNFYATLAAAGAYRHQALSIWARVPVRQKGDDANSGLSAFIPAALDEIAKHGVRKLPQTIRATWAKTTDDGIVRRLLRDEREARDRAEKVFRLVERECPLRLRRFDHEELWDAVYLGHRQNAQSVPIRRTTYTNSTVSMHSHRTCVRRWPIASRRESCVR